MEEIRATSINGHSQTIENVTKSSSPAHIPFQVMVKLGILCAGDLVRPRPANVVFVVCVEERSPSAKYGLLLSFSTTNNNASRTCYDNFADLPHSIQEVDILQSTCMENTWKPLSSFYEAFRTQFMESCTSGDLAGNLKQVYYFLGLPTDLIFTERYNTQLASTQPFEFWLKNELELLPPFTNSEDSLFNSGFDRPMAKEFALMWSGHVLYTTQPCNIPAYCTTYPDLPPAPRDYSRGFSGVLLTKAEPSEGKQAAENLITSLLLSSNRSKDEVVVFYHATTWRHAMSIISRGIDLNCGGGDQDFSHRNGFYLHENFDLAVEWLNVRYGGEGAIVIFCIPRQSVWEQLHNPKDFGTDCSQEWENVISAYRRASQYEDIEDNADRESDPLCYAHYDIQNNAYIRGYALSNVEAVKRDNKDPLPHHKPFVQVALRNADATQAFKQSGKAGIVFISNALSVPTYDRDFPPFLR
eukprot:scaffold2352_cov153-Ochromonas_danica.AAC.1